MARKPRLYLEKVSQNIMIKGINNQSIFLDDEDYNKGLEIIKISLNRELHMHSYCLLPTQINFYITPLSIDSIPRFIQKFGRLYVRFFNKKYNRSGTLWDGRYKSSLVEDIIIALDIIRYIEQLPQKLNYIDEFSKYNYSSYKLNINDESDFILSQHILVKELSENKKIRIQKYKEILNVKLSENKFKFIDNCLNKQLITGSSGFRKNLENLLGEKIASKKRGRPKQITKKRKSMYEKLVVLDKAIHKDLKILPLQNLEFAKNLSFIPIVANEIGLVGEKFPIVFSLNETPILTAIVSLGGSNLGLNNEYKWITNYIPVNLRKYPFSIAGEKENTNQRIILIDEESYLISTEYGNPIFNEQNEQTELLKNAINFLKDVDKNTILTSKIIKIIKDSNILENREISIGEGDEKRVLVKGFSVVNREKLNNLSDDVLADWTRKGIITFIDSHLKSLENIQKLFELASKQQ